MLLVFIVVVIPGHNLGNSQVSVNRTIGPTLVISYQLYLSKFATDLFTHTGNSQHKIGNYFLKFHHLF